MMKKGDIYDKNRYFVIFVKLNDSPCQHFNFHLRFALGAHVFYVHILCICFLEWHEYYVLFCFLKIKVREAILLIEIETSTMIGSGPSLWNFLEDINNVFSNAFIIELTVWKE